MKKHKILILAGVFVFLILLVAFLPKASSGKNVAPESDAAIVRITSVLASKTDLRSYLEINGNVEADNTVNVFPDISGKLVRLRVHLGSKVAKGEAIADVDPSKPGASYELSPVYAPISGTVTSLPEKIGSTLSTGTVVAAIGDIGNLQVTAKIPEREIAVLQSGLQAVLSFEAYPGIEFAASVFRVAPLVDPVSRTKEIFITFKNDDGKINAGMFAKIKLFTTVSKNCVAVPEDALVTNDDKYYAFVLTEDGSTVVRREVKKGVTVDGVTEIISGLEDGARVAYEGVSVLSDGVAVKDISAEGDGK